MANYDVGLITQSKIFNSCKKLFYEKGFKNTTYKDIQLETGVSPSLINYYFKSKNAIAGKIYIDMLKNIKDEVKKFMLEKYDFYELQYGTTTEHIIFLDLFYNNKNLKRFFYDISYKGILLEYDAKNLSNFYEMHNETYNLNLTPKKLKLIQIANASIGAGMTTKYFEGFIDVSIKEYMEFRTENMYRMMGVTQDRIREILDKSWEIYSEMDVELIDYFEVKIKLA